MIADNIVRGCAMQCVPILHALGILAIWHVYVVAAMYGLLMMISLAGGPALIPALVKRDQLETANALETLSFTLGGVIGPPVAGLLIAQIGAPNVVILDALSYFVFAACLWSVCAHHQAEGSPEAYGESLGRSHSIGDAIRLLLRNPVLLATTLMFFAFNIGGGLLAVWLPVLTDTVLGGGAQLFGLLLGILSAGEVASSVVFGGVRLPISLGKQICVAQALSGLALLLVLKANPALVAVAMALFGAFSAPLTIWAQTLRMRIIPEALRGRAFALLRTLMQAGNPLGGALAGLVIPALGVAAAVLLSGALVGIPGALGYGVRKLREA
jgi:predicted MFS family arabinose efflux permease